MFTAAELKTMKITTPPRAAIIRALERAGGAPLGPRQIAEACSMKAVNVSGLLIQMKKEGSVKRSGYGKYKLSLPVSSLPVTLITLPVTLR